MKDFDGVPDGAVIVNDLRIVEYLADDGTLMWCDLSDEDMETGKALELIERARAVYQAPMIAEILAEFFYLDKRDDED